VKGVSVLKPAFSSFYSVAPSQGSTPFQSKYQKNTFSGVLLILWWRRWESNPRPKAFPYNFLRAQSRFSYRLMWPI